jgi:pyroglutamyl-peptidase
MKILITSFGPFNDFEENPSNQVMNLLKEKVSSTWDCLINWHTLDVSYSYVDQFENLISKDNFDLVLHLGVATNDSLLRFELIAKNECSGKDVQGRDPEKRYIDKENGDLVSSFDINILNKLQLKHPNKIRFSNDAGTYLCNYLYYKSLLIFRNNSSVLFVHIADFQNNSKAVSPEEQAQILAEIIESSVLLSYS